MKANDELVDKLATLAKLEFDADKKKEIIQDLTQDIYFVEKLNELDTSGVEPLIFMTDEVNVLRPDVVKHDIPHEEALLNAPKKDSDYFKAPKVLGAKE